MLWFRRNNIISNQVVKAKADKIKKRALRKANKQIRKGELGDSHSLAMHLSDIDYAYTHLIEDIKSTKLDSAHVRARKMAKVGRSFSILERRQAELEDKQLQVNETAQAAGKKSDVKLEKSSSIDLTKLKAKFDDLSQKEY